MPVRSQRSKKHTNINAARKNLFLAMLSLKTLSECENFFADVATLGEVDALAERLEVARQLDSGKTYRTILKDTGVSLQTITRVSHWLHHGKGGYRTVLTRLKK